MKPIVLNFDKSGHDNEVSKTESVKQRMQTYVDEISNINGLQFTPELFSDLLQRGEKVADAIQDVANKQLDTAGITSASVKQSAIKGDVSAFYQVLARMRNDSTLTSHKYYLTVASGKVTVSESGLKEIESLFTHAVRTKEGKALYDAHIAMIESTNNFLEVAGVNAMYLPQYYTGQLTGVGKIEPTRVDYDRIAKQTA